MIQLATDELAVGVPAHDGTERLLCRALSVQIEAGQNWVILGANGSGKTSLLHTLAGLRGPQAGRVLLDGESVHDMHDRERARRIGVLFQHGDSAFPAGVFETVLSGRHPHHRGGWWQWESERDHALAWEALRAVALDGFAARNIATLSGGEQRRADIATLLTQDAPLCLADEPTNHLDLNFQVRTLELLAARVQRPGHANVLVLHDINLALRFGSHGILLFGDGEHINGPLHDIVTVDTLERLYRCPMRSIHDGTRSIFLPA